MNPQGVIWRPGIFLSEDIQRRLVVTNGTKPHAVPLLFLTVNECHRKLFVPHLGRAQRTLSGIEIFDSSQRHADGTCPRYRPEQIAFFAVVTQP